MAQEQATPPPGMVGYWEVPGVPLRLSCVSKPPLFYRIMARILVGWKWVKWPPDA